MSDIFQKIFRFSENVIQVTCMSFHTNTNTATLEFCKENK